MAHQLTKAQVIEGLHASKGLVNIAAEKLKCTPATIYNWINKSPDVKAVLDAERESFIDKAELGLMAAVSKQEAWAITLALKTVGKRRGYVERSEHVLIGVSPELAQKFAEAAAAAGVSPGDALEAYVQELAHAGLAAGRPTDRP